MLPLSSAYHKNVIQLVMDKCYTNSGNDIKTLVLSSPEMSHAFGLFMRDFVVEYNGYYTAIFNDVRSYEYHNQCNWIEPFVRKLNICGHITNVAQTKFFEKVFRNKSLEELNLKDLKNYFSSEIIQNLISITRKLKIRAPNFHRIQEFLPRFETIFFYHDCKVPDKFVNHLKSDTSVILELYFESQKTMRDHMKILIPQLTLIRKVYVGWHPENNCSEFKDLVDCLSKVSQNVENIIVGTSLIGNLHESSEKNHDDVTSFLESQKEKFDFVVTTLQEISPLIKTNLFFSFYDVPCFKDTKFGDDPFELVNLIFPPNDFVVTKGHRTRNIINRQKKLMENVEISYKIDIWGTSLIAHYIYDSEDDFDF